MMDTVVNRVLIEEKSRIPAGVTACIALLDWPGSILFSCLHKCGTSLSHIFTYMQYWLG